MTTSPEEVITWKKEVVTSFGEVITWMEEVVTSFGEVITWEKEVVTSPGEVITRTKEVVTWTGEVVTSKHAVVTATARMESRTRDLANTPPLTIKATLANLKLAEVIAILDSSIGVHYYFCEHGEEISRGEVCRKTNHPSRTRR